jgi:hypothetical protein
VADSYVRFREVPHPSKGAVTKFWFVESTSDTQLGFVKWYAPWRCYCFEPYPLTIFNEGCLMDIAGFCKNETYLHREAKKATGPIGQLLGETEDRDPLADPSIYEK